MVSQVTMFALQAAGAIGVLIVDDGRCQAFDQRCMPGAEKKHKEKFAIYDDSGPW